MCQAFYSIAASVHASFHLVHNYLLPACAETGTNGANEDSHCLQNSTSCVDSHVEILPSRGLPAPVENDNFSTPGEEPGHTELLVFPG